MAQQSLAILVQNPIILPQSLYTGLIYTNVTEIFLGIYARNSSISVNDGNGLENFFGIDVFRLNIGGKVYKGVTNPPKHSTALQDLKWRIISNKTTACAGKSN